jgi:hypothetical protein
VNSQCSDVGAGMFSMVIPLCICRYLSHVPVVYTELNSISRIPRFLTSEPLGIEFSLEKVSLEAELKFLRLSLESVCGPPVLRA